MDKSTTSKHSPLSGSHNPSMSAAEYGQLVDLVDSLKLENTTLKKELQNNSTQISRLETEAGNLKQMFLKLVTTLPAADKVESNMHLNGLDLPQIGLQSSVARTHDSTFKGGVTSNNAHDINVVTERIHREILKLTLKRYDVMDALKSEEIKKECYMQQLTELQRTLDEATPSDKFAKLDETTRHFLEAEIQNIQDKMAEVLGPKDSMNLRVQSWISDIHNIEKEIASLKQHLSVLESSRNHSIIQTPNIEYDDAFCTVYENSYQYQHIRDVCTQTYNAVFSFDQINCTDEFVVNKNGSSSRSCQTRATSIPKLKQANLSLSCDPYSAVAMDKMFPGVSNESVSSSPTDIDDTASMHSFTASLPNNYSEINCPKVDVFYSLLSMLGINDNEETIRNSNPPNISVEDACRMRKAGYIPVLVQLIHDGSILRTINSFVKNNSTDQATAVMAEKAYKAVKYSLDRRKRASLLLYKIVNLNPDNDGRSKELPIYEHFQVIRMYCEKLHELWLRASCIHLKESPCSENKDISNSLLKYHNSSTSPPVVKECWREDHKNSSYDFKSALVCFYKPPVASVSFIAENSQNPMIKNVIIDLGGLPCHAELLVLHYRCALLIGVVKNHISLNENKFPEDLTDRRETLLHHVTYTLIGLSYKNTANKAAFINMPGLLETVGKYLETESEKLQQMLANFVRNLSWQADEQCREVLLKSKITPVLMKCVLKVKTEETMKTFLCALWNLSGHCPQNREDICAVEGALAFLVSTLTFRSPTKSSEIVEGGGGILRNVSTVVAVSEKYRQVLRDNNCLQILLSQLTSPSITIVNNACGTLWNLSARNAKDQNKLRELGAEKLLKNLVNSKHALISQGSRAALKNLQAEKGLNSPAGPAKERKDNILEARKRKNMQSNQMMTDEHFSPRHHAWMNNEKPLLTKHNIPQRHSLQETSGQNMIEGNSSRNLQSSTLQYSGSLGSLPSNYEDAYNSTANLKMSTYVPRNQYTKYKKNPQRPVTFSQSHNHEMGHSNFRNIVKASAGQASQSLRSGYQPQFNNNNNSAHHSNAFQNMYLSPTLLQTQNHEQDFMKESAPMNNYLWNPNSTQPWYHQDRGQNSNIPRPSGAYVNTSNPGKLTPNKPANLNAIFKNGKSPEEALRNLQNAEENYVSDDRPVDYSLQFQDDSQSEKVEEKDMPNNFHVNKADVFNKHKQNLNIHSVANPKTHSEGGFSSLSSCIGSNTSGNSGVPRHDITKNTNDSLNQNTAMNMYLQKNALKNANMQKAMTNLDDMNFEDEKPKNFSEIYGEKVSEYSCYNIADPEFDASKTNEINDKKLSNENVGQNSLKNDATKNDNVLHDNTHQSNGYKEDKYESKPGTITPGTHYSKGGRRSGIMTPKTPNYTETPLVYSPTSSVASLDSFDEGSIHSNVTSDPGSRMMSERASPSQLPDSPSQSMPISPRHSPRTRSRNDLREVSNAERKIEPKSDNGPITNPLNSDRMGSVNLDRINDPKLVPVPPQSDEMRSFNYEGSISGVTTFSALTIDTDVKIKPLRNDNKSLPPKSNENKNVRKVEITHPGLKAILDAGYVTSLPTNDEIKSFVQEGNFSPMVALSEISVLHKDNEGFEAATTRSTRSSATGESMPKPFTKVTPVPEKPAEMNGIDAASEENKESHDDSFSSSSDDDAENLLNQIIKSAIPKKKPASKSVTKSRSRSKDKTSKDGKQKAKKEENGEKAKPTPAPKPERKVINIKQKLANADSKLNGKSIVDYIDNLMKSTDDDANDAAAKSKQVIDDAEKLQPSYSVMKHKKETEKQRSSSEKYADEERLSLVQVPKTTGLLPFEPTNNIEQSSSTKVHAFLQNRPITYVVEGTPIELSRSTSLSNLTVDSGPHENEYIALQSKLKPSRSTSDMEKYSNLEAASNTKPAIPQDGYQQPPQLAAVNPKKTVSPTPDSRQILADLGKQIDNISISTVEAAITSKYPGYVPSLPQSDEIIKYSAEGSLSGGTIFSGLTIDSDTKIAPCAPDENHNTEVGKMPRINENGVADIPVIPYTYDTDYKDGTYSFHKVEDTPVCFSRNSSLSSLDFDSEDDNDLLSACITSAIPPEKQQNYPVPQQLVSHVNHDHDGTAPCCVSGPIPYHQTHQRMFQNQYQPTTSASNMLSPNSEEWSLLRKDANAVSANLAGQNYQNGSGSNTYNDRVTDPTEGYYHLSQIPSNAADSDLSISSSVFGENDNLEGYKKRGPVINPPERSQPKAIKGGKKNYKSSVGVKGRDGGSRNGRTSKESKDNISSSSSSYQKQRQKHHSHRSGNNMTSDDMQHSSHYCPNCHVGSSHENMTSPRQFRKKSTNSSCSKQSGVCDGGNMHNHFHGHQRQRSRHSNKNAYHPSVIQLYPPIKDVQLQQVMLNGVANIAAQGGHVVAVGTLTKQQKSPQKHDSSQSSNPQLERQNTYIKDEPSPELLQSLTSSESHSIIKSTRSVQSLSPAHSKISMHTTGNMSVSPKGSMMSVRSQPANMSSQIRKAKPTKKTELQKNRGGKMWKGLKKLLSPSDDPKSFDKTKSPAKKSNSKNQKKVLNQIGQQKTFIKSSSNKNSNNKQDMVTVHEMQNSDSLSLSSSSASNISFSETENVIGTSALPYGHIPTKQNTVAESYTTKQHSNPVWRRTPPIIDNTVTADGNGAKYRSKTNVTNSTSVDFATRSLSQMSITSKTSTTKSNDVWVQKDPTKTNNVIGSNNCDNNKYLARSKSDAHPISNEKSISPRDVLSESSNVTHGDVTNHMSPVRTQSPRIVQVAPFNYKPSKPSAVSPTPDGKSSSDNSCQPDADVKQTIV